MLDMAKKSVQQPRSSSLTEKQTVKQENASLLKKKNNANNNRLSSQSLLTRIAPFTSRQYLLCNYHNCMVCWLLVPPRVLSLYLLAQEIRFQVILLEQDFTKCNKQIKVYIIVVFYYMMYFIIK